MFTLEPTYMTWKDKKGRTHVAVEQVSSHVRWIIKNGKMVKTFDYVVKPF